MISLTEAVNEVEMALSPMPDGYYVTGDDKHNFVLVCCKYPEPEGLGFAITTQEISDGLHVEHAEVMFPQLIKAVDEAMKKGIINGAHTSDILEHPFSGGVRPSDQEA